MADGGKSARGQGKPVLTLADQGMLALDREHWVNTSLDPGVRNRLLDVERRSSAAVGLLTMLRRDEAHAEQAEACGDVDYKPLGGYFRAALMSASLILLSDVGMTLEEVGKQCQLPVK